MVVCSPDQRAIIEQPIDAPALLVVAGPGSGKTRVLCERIVYLIAQGVEPREITAVTFTQLAAAELRDRVQLASAADVWTGTFHAFAYRVLHEHGALWGYPRPIRVLDERTQRFVIRNAFQSVAGWRCDEFQARHIAGQISLRKRRGLTCDEMDYQPDDRGGLTSDRLRAVDERYAGRLAEERWFDYDELIYQVNRGLPADEASLETVRQQARWLMVDEYQEDSDEQYALISLITPPRDPRAHLFAVADPRQSIYRFRGANSTELLNRLTRDYRPHRLHLKENYRSVRSVVSCATALQPGPDHPSLFAVDQASPGLVHVYADASEIEECRRVAALIERRIAEGDEPESIAVLYSTHRRADLLEQTLVDGKIPVYRHRRDGLHDRPETEAILALMRCIDDVSDPATLLRAIGVGPSWLVDELDWLQLDRQAPSGTGDRAIARRLAALRRCVETVRSARDVSAYQALTDCLFENYGALLDPVQASEREALLDALAYAPRFTVETWGAIKTAVDAGTPFQIRASASVDAQLGQILLEQVIADSAGDPTIDPFQICLDCDLPAGSRGVRIEVVLDRTTTVTITTQAWLIAQSLLAPTDQLDISFVAIDLETTSKYPSSADIIEIGAVRFDGNGIGERFTSLIRTGYLPRDITQLTGIRLAELQSEPTAETVLREFAAWLRPDDVLVGHNVEAFDLAVLNRHLTRHVLPPIENMSIDTLPLSRRLLPGISHELQDLRATLGFTPRAPHRALPDAETTRELFLHLLDVRNTRLTVRTLDDALPLVAASILSREQPPDGDGQLLVACGGRRLRMGISSPLVDRARERLGAHWGWIEQRLRDDTHAPATLEEETWKECRQEWQDLLGHHARLYPELTPAELIGSLALSFQTNPVLKPDRITMMTIHAAKGKEWPTVIIIGAEDDQFPASRAPSPEDLEEGNRLLYVGATRAQRRLAILHARQRDDRPRDPSRFLFAFPDDPAVVHWPGRRRNEQPAGTIPV